MCSFADNFFENACSQNVGAFGIKMKDEVDPETGETKKVFDEANSTTHCGQRRFRTTNPDFSPVAAMIAEDSGSVRTRSFILDAGIVHRRRSRSI